MKIRIGKLILTISLSVAETLPELVDRFARKHFCSKEYLDKNDYPHKLARCKACRELDKQGRFHPTTSLRDIKEWIDKHFEDDGHGAIKS